MAQTIAGLFPGPEEARAVVEALTALGVAREDISLVGGNAGGHYPLEDVRTNETPTGERVLTGVEAGAVAGGATGFLLGAVGLALPVIGPVVATGVLASLLAGAGVGAAAGGLIGALTHAGVPAADAPQFADGVRQGGVIVTARVPDETAGEAQGVFALHNAVRDFRRSPTPPVVNDIPESERTLSSPPRIGPTFTRTQTDEDPLSEIAIGRATRP